MSELHIKLGELLQLERGRQGIVLENVAAELKIPEETLLHIEAGEIEALPAELYFNLFAKSYAEFLGIDYTKTLEAIREEIGEDIEPREEPTAEPTRKSKPTRKAGKGEPEKKRMPGDPELGDFVKKVGILAGVAVGGFVVVMAAYLVFFKSDSDETARQNDTAMASEEVNEPSSEATSSLASAYDWNTPTYQSPDSIRIGLRAREQSWATVVADGDTALYRNLIPGRDYQIAAQYRLVVSVGVPRLVDVSLDGRPADLTSSTGRISRVEIDQTNRTQFLVGTKRPQSAIESSPTPASDAVEGQTEDVPRQDEGI